MKPKYKRQKETREIKVHNNSLNCTVYGDNFHLLKTMKKRSNKPLIVLTGKNIIFQSI